MPDDLFFSMHVWEDCVGKQSSSQGNDEKPGSRRWSGRGRSRWKATRSGERKAAKKVSRKVKLEGGNGDEAGGPKKKSEASCGRLVGLMTGRKHSLVGKRRATTWRAK